MFKGIEILRLVLSPGELRKPVAGEAFVPLVRVGVAKTARDGAEVYQGDQAEAACGLNPRIVEKARELLDLIATELATQNAGQRVYVVTGPNVKTDFATYHAGGEVEQRAADAIAAAPAPGARPSESSLDLIKVGEDGVPRMMPRAEQPVGEGPGAFAPPLESVPRVSRTGRPADAVPAESPIAEPPRSSTGDASHTVPAAIESDAEPSALDKRNTGLDAPFADDVPAEAPSGSPGAPETEGAPE